MSTSVKKKETHERERESLHNTTDKITFTMGHISKYTWAVLDFLERIPMSITYDIILIVFLVIMEFGLFWIIMRNEVMPPVGHAMSDVTSVLDDAQTFINSIIHEIRKIGIHIGEMPYDDLTQASDADIIAHLPSRCVHYETTWEVIFSFIDIANANKLCPAIRYIEPIDWLRDVMQWLINYQDYTSSCGIARLASVCTYAGIGYIVHDLGMTLIILILILCARELEILIISDLYNSAKVVWKRSRYLLKRLQQGKGIKADI